MKEEGEWRALAVHVSETVYRFTAKGPPVPVADVRKRKFSWPSRWWLISSTRGPEGTEELLLVMVVVAAGGDGADMEQRSWWW